MTLSRLPPGGRVFALAAMLGLAVATGCSGSAGAGASVSGAGGAAGSGGAERTPDSLAFAPTTTVTLVPEESRQLSLHASPPGVYRVRLALLGDFADASLDASEIYTADDGTAHFQLVAPSSPTTFTVRASVGSAVSTSLAVSVSESGFATVQVKPMYAGKRTVSYWVASVHTGTSCESLTGTPPPDGDLSAQTIAGQIPQLEDVPVGPVLAVTLRTGHFAGGCIDVQKLVAGVVNPVSVPVIDRPIQLADTDLDVRLGLDADGWQKSLSDDLTPTTQAMLDGASDDIEALLDAMRESASDADQASAFETARQSYNWDSVLSTALGVSTPPAMLRSQVKAWMSSGIASLTAPDTFQGHLLATGQAPGKAELDLERVGGVDPADAGFPVQNLVSWSADANDTVALGANLVWLPSRLLTALATKPALAAHPGTSSVPEVLEQVADCSAVAGALTGQGQVPAFGSCDKTCIATLCHDAVALMWQRARDASGNDWSTGMLDMSATGSAQVDDIAAPRSFDGTWIGKLTLGSTSTSVGGPASGNAQHPK